MGELGPSSPFSPAIPKVTPGWETPCGGGAGLGFSLFTVSLGEWGGGSHLLSPAGSVLQGRLFTPSSNPWSMFEAREQWGEQGGEHKITRGKLSVLRMVGKRVRIHLSWSFQTLQDSTITLIGLSNEIKLGKWFLQHGCSRSEVTGWEGAQGGGNLFPENSYEGFFMPSLHSKAKGEGGDRHCGLRVGWDPSFTHPRAAMGDTEAVPGEPHCQGTGEWHFTEREKNREEKAMCRLEESGRSRVVLGVWSSPKSLEPLSAPTEPVPYSISST